MALTIEDSIKEVFSCYYRDSRSFRIDRNTKYSKNNFKYLEIPTVGETIEIPIFALKELSCYYYSHHELPLKIAVNVHFSSSVSMYKAFRSNILEVFARGKTSDGFVKVISDIKDSETTINYYGGGGSIFTSDLEPLIISSFLIRKMDDYKLKIIRPVCRINRRILAYTNQNDAMEKFIAKSLFPNLITTKIRFINKYDLNYADNKPFIESTGNCIAIENSNILIEIDDTLFRLFKPVAPTIQTTTKDLLDSAYNALDYAKYSY